MGEAAPKEGSMEDILASIRRIITSDGEKHAKPASVSSAHDQSPKAPTVSSMPQAPAIADRPRLSELAARVTNMHTTGDAAPNSPKPVSDRLAQPAAEVKQPVAAPGSLAEMAMKMRAGDENIKPSAFSMRKSGEQDEFEPAMENTLRPTVSEPVEAGAPDTEKTVDTGVEEIQASEPQHAASMSFSRFAADALSRPEPMAEEEPVVNADTSANPPAEPIEPSSDEGSQPTEAAVEEVDLPKEPETMAVAQAPFSAPKSEELGKSLPPQGNRDDVAGKFREALVSPSTAQSVAGSMERLRKSVSDQQSAITEAALRPMLKEWLDDNLPAMVEKMVREEIDRISANVQEPSAKQA